MGKIILGFFWNIGYWDGGAYRKIAGNGTVNTIVKDVNENNVLLSAPEVP